MEWNKVIGELNEGVELCSDMKTRILSMRGENRFTWELFLALVQNPYEKQQGFFVAAHVATNLMLPKIRKITAEINYRARVHVTVDEIYSEVYWFFCRKKCPAFDPGISVSFSAYVNMDFIGIRNRFIFCDASKYMTMKYKLFFISLDENDKWD